MIPNLYIWEMVGNHQTSLKKWLFGGFQVLRIFSTQKEDGWKKIFTKFFHHFYHFFPLKPFLFEVRFFHPKRFAALFVVSTDP